MTDAKHGALLEALAAYSIDAVDDPRERAEINSHLRVCASCREELDRLQASAAVLVPAGAPPSNGLWDRISAEIHEPTADVPGRVVPLSRRWFPILSAAAAVMLVALVGVQTLRLNQARNDLELSRQQLSALQGAVAAGDYETIAQLASAAPGTITVALQGDAGAASAVILPDGSGYLDVHELQPLDGTSAYQLWAVLDGEVISAAVLGAGDQTVAPFQVDPASLEALVVTREAAGGVAESAQPVASAWSTES